MDNLNHLYTFYIVAQAGSLTQAATQLHITQSAVSHSLKALEDILGTQLIDRAKRRFVMTQSGEMLLETCRSIFEQYATTKEKIRLLTHGLEGRVVVGSHIPLGARWLSRQIAPLQKKYPGIRIDLNLDNETNTLLQDLYHYKSDLLIIITPDTTTIPETIQLDQITQAHFDLIASPEYLKKSAPLKNAKDLAQHTLLGLSADFPVYQFLIGRALKLHTPPKFADVRYINNVDAMINACIDGLGLIYMPDHLVAPHLRAKELLRVKTHVFESESPVFMAYRKGSLEIPRIKVVHDYLAASLQKFKT